MRLRALFATALVLLLTGCDQLATIPGIGPDPRIAQREEEAKAIGGACRHALRGPEDCYALNPKASKSAIFAGWKEMDQYMRENKIEGSPSVIAPAASKPAAAEKREASAEK